MAAVLTSVKDDLATKCVVDTSVNTTAVENATGAAGAMYMVEIDTTAGVATAGEPACYVKFINASSSVVGGGNSSSIPELVLYAPIGQVTSYVISGGWVFGTGLSYWAVTTAALAGDTSPTSDVKVTILSS
tara:strand:- start:472 stop:864 length:393 start_codon:yes stop_codon:yes gene_type:complete